MMMPAGGRWSSYLEEQKRRGRKNNRKVVRRLIRAFRPYPFQLFLTIIAILLSSILALVPTLLTPLVFDVAIPHRNLALLLWVAILMIIAVLISGIAGVWQTYLTNKVGQNVMRDFRYKLYEHLQDMSFHFFTSTRTGEIQSRLTNDVNSAQSAVTDTFSLTLTNLISVVVAVIAMVAISPILTLVYLAMAPFFLWLTVKVGEVRRRISQKTQQSQASLNALLQETLSVSGILLIKTFGRKKFALSQFGQENQRVADLSLRQQLVGRWLMMFMSSFSSLIAPILYIIVGWLLMNHIGFFNITLGGLITFILLQTRLFTPLNSLVTLQVNVQGSLALFDRIFEYLDLPLDLKDAPDAIELSPETCEGRVTLSNVSFTYKLSTSDLFAIDSPQMRPRSMMAGMKPMMKSHGTAKSEGRNGSLEHVIPGKTPASDQRRLTLQNISLEVRPGQLVALVGPSGAGKTTITYLIPRLYDVDSGSVEIDGHNVKDVTLASLCSLTGVVTQETYLFHASVRENLLYVRPEASEEELIAAARAAAIHDTIMQLEHGYDTIVGERGYRLSGGEKQRLAIARVLLKNPRILILDEATSSLDTRSERLIQQALQPLMRNRTTIAIAHRLSTILAADIILVVDKGSIVERGTHQELLDLGGVYTRLYWEQFGHKSLETAPTEAPGIVQ